MAKVLKTVRAICDSCQQRTNHKVQASYKHVEAVTVLGLNRIIHFNHDYTVIQCAGCDTISFLHIHPVDGDDAIYYQYPQPAKLGDTPLFLNESEQWQLPEMIRGLYMEVVDAFKSNSNVLAGLGLRTLVEAICIHRKIPGRNLEVKIQNLQVKGFISSAELPILDKLRVIGNVSAHKIKSVKMDALNHAIQIVNHVIKSIYILPLLNKKIKV